MADYTASDFRKGLRVELDGVPYLISEFNFVKPGKGAAIYTCRLKSLIDGGTFVRAFRSNDVLKKPDLEERTMRYSHNETDHYIFMDENYEQFTLTADVLAAQSTYSVAVDGRFKGGHITRSNGRPADGVHAVQLEMAWRCYMDDTPPFGYRDDLASRVQPVLQQLMAAMLAFAEGTKA